MASWLQKLKGNLFLAYRAVLVHPLGRLSFSDDRSGKERFLDNYAPEGNVIIEPETRSALLGASRCIHCGLCDAYDPLLSELPRTAYLGASTVPTPLSRAAPQLRHARALLQRLDPQKLKDAERICPTGVPLVSLALALKRLARDVEAAEERRTDERLPLQPDRRNASRHTAGRVPTRSAV